MAKCNECKRNFSNHLIQPLFAKGVYTPMCPICALEITNRIHGMDRTEFQGEMANELLEEARKEINE